MGQAFELRKDPEDPFHILYFDLQGSKVNKFSTPVMDELDLILDELKKDSTIQALMIVSLKAGIFIAGADIQELAAIQSPRVAEDKARRGQTIFQKLADLPFPTVAVINGACLGGGMELALACDFRIGTDFAKTKLGLPEVNLGIIPGWGGTQRLPRLIGLPQALQMICGGKPIDGKKALSMGLTDSLCANEFIVEQAKEFILKIQDPVGRKEILTRRKQSLWHRLFSSVIFSQARKQLLKKTKGHFPAPLKALEVIQRTWAGAMPDGLAVEAAAFGELGASRISKNLIHLFFVNEALRKETGLPPGTPSGSSFTITHTGVLGAGVMGGGIAWLFSRKGFPVRMKDIAWEAIGKGLQQASRYFQKVVQIRRLSSREMTLGMHRISGTVDYSGFRQTDLVVEAVVENMGLKKKVLAELEKELTPETIICSNTSSLSITEMAKSLEHPQRFIGMHFFNPVNRMPLVEVIPGKATSSETVVRLVAFTRGLGKTPIVVQDGPGFIVNRILVPYMLESVYLLMEGSDPEKVDQAVEDFGMPMGPFALADEIGLDVSFKVAGILIDALGTRYHMPALLRILYQDHKLLGKKGGAGFYKYDRKGKRLKINPVLRSVLNKIPEPQSKIRLREDIKTQVERLVFLMINEAAACMQEKIVYTPEALDIAMIKGTGFPPFRGGLLRYADEVSASKVVQSLGKFAEQHGERFKPCAFLAELALQQGTFFNKSGISDK